MANKRIELEQCKYFISLFDEYPNRKTIKKGATILFVVAILVVFALFVYGMLSNDLAKNPRNVIEQPAGAAPSTPEGIPDGAPASPEAPVETPVSPEGIPQPAPGESRAPGHQEGELASDILTPNAAIQHGELLAQAQPETDTSTPESSIPEIPAPPEETVEEQPPAEQSAPQQEQKDTRPGKETRGAGNLANLANWISGRGFQLYLMVIAVALIIILYVALRRIRLKGKSK